MLRLRDDLLGVIFRGRPDDRDVDVVLGALAAGMVTDGPSRTALIVDMRRLEYVDLRAFDHFLSFWDPIWRLVTRQAVLHGAGLVTAIAGAFCSAFNPWFPGRAFAEPLEAIAWLGLRDRAVLEDLDRANRDTTSNGSFLSAVRAHLRTNPGSALAELGEALRVSPRTLQRRLSEVRTTFQQEATYARLRTAKTLMTVTDYPLKHVALDCGFASLQHFSAFFRERVGIPPSRWRALHARDVLTRARPIHGGAPW